MLRILLSEIPPYHGAACSGFQGARDTGEAVGRRAGGALVFRMSRAGQTSRIPQTNRCYLPADRTETFLATHSQTRRRSRAGSDLVGNTVGLAKYLALNDDRRAELFATGRDWKVHRL